jgi:hypothetical protein
MQDVTASTVDGVLAVKGARQVDGEPGTARPVDLHVGFPFRVCRVCQDTFVRSPVSATAMYFKAGRVVCYVL